MNTTDSPNRILKLVRDAVGGNFEIIGEEANSFSDSIKSKYQNFHGMMYG
ncbi:MAG TPA: hypothetical protein PK079_25340 [Leptospiraceae bacterium]|nr:hypothetical protein [Leptospiraceae bacterium]HMX34043.1 hypothetical protein [Leptospiraceae bacterium]HMY32983.1 hypothetical protein [Leptospiraceae bacterium]HNA08165.1 hypothetical protein [Leptospiraceae bacterium]HNB97844.1 hypothetical protein [Leptospiraceae bacterium]